VLEDSPFLALIAIDRRNQREEDYETKLRKRSRRFAARNTPVAAIEAEITNFYGKYTERADKIRHTDPEPKTSANRRRKIVLSFVPWRRGSGTNAAAVCVVSADTETHMTKPLQPVPEDNKSHKGPGSEPEVALDTTKAPATTKNTTSQNRATTAIWCRNEQPEERVGRSTYLRHRRRQTHERNSSAVIASEAKQSRSHEARLDCSSLAPRK